MSRKFRPTVHQRGDICFVKLAGVLDEDSDLGALLEQIRGRTTLIHLGELDRVNSYGVREWVEWRGRLEERGIEVVLLECSPAVVAQINLVRNFAGQAAVKSFFVPYFCVECDAEKMLLCETAEIGPPPHEPPICRCDECDLVMDFDEMPNTYFAFVSRVRGGETDSQVASVIEEMAAADGEKSRIRSRVASASGSGLGRMASSLPSVPSLPGLGTGAGLSGHGAPEEGDPTGEARAAGAGDPSPADRGALMARVLIAVLVVALVGLAYLLFAEP